jgi:hypothetical protein
VTELQRHRIERRRLEDRTKLDASENLWLARWPPDSL